MALFILSKKAISCVINDFKIINEPVKDILSMNKDDSQSRSLVKTKN